MTTRHLVPHLVALALLVLPLAACTTSGGGFVLADANLVSLEEEWKLGRQIEADLARKLDLVRDRTALAALDRMGQAIVGATSMSNLPWKFHLVRDPAINAFNVPGGHVYVNTGLVAASDDAAELMGVIAHEVAHGVERHGTERLTRAYGFNALAGMVLGQNPGTVEQLTAQIVGAGTFANFSRAAERQADQHGVHYMARAGFDPEGMAEIFETLLEQRQRRPSQLEQFFASHPLTEDRIREVRQLAASVAEGDLRTGDRDFRVLRNRVG